MSMVVIATHFLGIFTVCKFAFVILVSFCESSVFLSRNLVLFRNNRVATLVETFHLDIYVGHCS